MSPQDEPWRSAPAHAGRGSAGKAPLLPSRGGELRTSAPVGPQFYSVNCPQALVKASQPHESLARDFLSADGAALVSGGRRKSGFLRCPPSLPETRTQPKPLGPVFHLKEAEISLPVIKLGTPNLHLRGGAALLCIRSPMQKTAALPRRRSPPPLTARHGHRAQGKTACTLPSRPRGPSPWHQVPTA